MSTTSTNIRMNDELHKEAKIMAVRKHITFTELMEVALRRYLNEANAEASDVRSSDNE